MASFSGPPSSICTDRTSSSFSQPSVSVNSFSKPRRISLRSLKLKSRSDDVLLRTRTRTADRFGGKSSRSFVVRCDASSNGRITQQEFTEMAWQAIVSSPEVAKENKHQIVETEHLMKALLEQKNGLARRIFSKAGVDNTRLKEHPVWDDGDEDEDEDEDVFDSRLQFLEERDEKNLSWRLLKLSRADKVRSALDLYVSMDFMGLRPESHAFNALLSCLLRNGELDDALQVFESMKSNDRTSGHSYNLILQGVAKARGFEAAFEMFDELVTDEISRNKVDQVLFNMMLTLCRDNKDWAKTEFVWRKMKDNNCVGNSVTYRLLVTTFLGFSQYGLAIEAYLEMVQNRVEPDARTMEAVTIAFAKDGRWDFALSVFRGMMKRKENPNVIVFNALIHSLGNNGQVNLAFKVYDCMKSLGHVPTSYTWNALLVALCRADQHGDALRLFEKIQHETPSALGLHLYNTALTACKQVGAWRRALQILWEMEDLGLSVPVTSYCRVIGACEVGNEPKVALQVYQHMVHQKKTPDTLTLLSLIRSSIWGSLYDEVHEILKLVPPNAHLYNAAVQGFCLRQKTGSATKLYQEMRELGLSSDHKTRAMMLQFLPRS